jgi:DnaJ family protein A protein 2
MFHRGEENDEDWED